MSRDLVWGTPGLSDRLFLHPASDRVFRRSVDDTLQRSGLSAKDPAIEAAVHALLRTSYPMAHIQLRTDLPSGAGLSMWDVFRDDDSLDRELARRARHGDAASAGQLYDRHGRLAFAVAFDAAGDRDAAASAVIAGYKAVLARPSSAVSLRVAIAIAARSSAISSVTPHEPGPGRAQGMSSLHRSVIELALIHGLLGTEIALVLGLDIRDVRRLANEGLTAIARTLSKTAPSEDP